MGKKLVCTNKSKFFVILIIYPFAGFVNHAFGIPGIGEKICLFKYSKENFLIEKILNTAK